MSIRIGSIGISLGAIRSLQAAERAVAQSSARLASGYRINRASDDPAGLAVSEKLRASLSRAQLNTQDGVSLAQVAQGGLAEISTLLSEARALAVQSSSGSLGGQTRDQFDTQFQAILSDIDAIANNTSYSKFNPLADSTLQIELAVGTEAGDTITVSGADAQASAIGVGSLDIATAASGIASIDTAIENVTAPWQLNSGSPRTGSNPDRGCSAFRSKPARAPIREFATPTSHSKAPFWHGLRSFGNRRSP